MVLEDQQVRTVVVRRDVEQLADERAVDGPGDLGLALGSGGRGRASSRALQQHLDRDLSTAVVDGGPNLAHPPAAQEARHAVRSELVSGVDRHESWIGNVPALSAFAKKKKRAAKALAGGPVATDLETA
ncbi:MAG: hypothetical protein IPG04_14760 [Polyangiaceae bacterium]|nr:hypothetical protein [Polyangiaceae bacterium]